MCPHSNMHRKKEIMSPSLFEKIATQTQEFGVKEVVLSGIGEPLLDPHLVDRVRELKSLERTVRVYSNGSLLTRDKGLELIHAGLDILNICIDGVKSETYEKIREGLKLTQVVERVEDFIKIKGKGNPLINIGFVNLKLNTHEKLDFIKRWKRKADTVYISLPNNWAGSKFIEKFPEFESNLRRQGATPCVQLWRGMYILVNGDVVPCCRDYEGKIVLGNLKDTTLEQIWYGEKLKKLREIHLRFKRESISLCRKCIAIDDISSTVWWQRI